MYRCLCYSAALAVATFFCVSSVARAEDSGTVKVFLLAGQSNMVGQASNTLLESQAKAPETRKIFAHLRKDGKWIVRDDVFIKFFERHGGLTIGYGARNHTGPALQFGTLMGNHFEEPVLLIKTAWGGHSLYRNFRPPSAGLPSEKKLEAELANARKRVKQQNKRRKRNDPLPTMADIKAAYGKSYRMMVAEVRSTIANVEKYFPALQGKKLEIVGFVWFQGFNDKFNDADKEYAENMKCFIRDVRKDFGVPKMPFVIAALGPNGSAPATGTTLSVREAQMSMAEVKEFQGNLKVFRTDVLVDKAAEKLYPMWRQRRAEWEKVGSDRPYHYLGSAIWFHRIGNAMGEAMLELLKEA